MKRVLHYEKRNVPLANQKLNGLAISKLKKGCHQAQKKCKIIKDWPQPTSCANVKSFLQTVQFNTKFLSGKGMNYLTQTLPSHLKN